jgi:hypothetical protein
VNPYITSLLAFDYQEHYHGTWDPEDTRVSSNYTNPSATWLPAKNQNKKQDLNRYTTRQPNKMTSSPPLTTYLFFWNLKTSTDNDWHPYPGASPTKYLTTAPAWSKRLDLPATAVDAAPFVFLSGALTHLRQLPHLGSTARFSPLANPLTMQALHRSALVSVPAILLAQAVGLEYRYVIPRWSHDRERARDEEQARSHVEVGMFVGGAVMVGRSLAGLGPRWSLVDLVVGGAVADLLLREYYKSHGI